MAHLYLTQHHECILDLLRRGQGVSDSPPTNQGKRQIEVLLQRIEEVPLDLVIMGPRGRHRILGEAVASQANCPAIVEPRLDELDLGYWECLTSKEAKKLWPTEWGLFEVARETLDTNFQVPGGESFGAVKKRVAEILNEHDFSKNTLVISSGFIVVLMIKLIMPNSPIRSAPHCALTEFVGNSLKDLEVVRILETKFLPPDSTGQIPR